MKKKNKVRLVFWVVVALMLMAIWAYVASLDDSEPLNKSLSEVGPLHEPAK